MSINDLLGEHTPLPKEHRFTPRSPVSVKELIMIGSLAALAWGAYEKLNKFAEKSAVERVVETQWQQRLETQQDRLETKAALTAIKEELQRINLKVDTIPKRKP